MGPGALLVELERLCLVPSLSQDTGLSECQMDIDHNSSVLFDDMEKTDFSVRLCIPPPCRSHRGDPGGAFGILPRGIGA